MGNVYSISEGGEEGGGGGGGGLDTNNSNRPPQQQFGEVETEGESVYEEYGLSDAQMASLNEARIDEDLPEDAKAQIKEEMAAGMASGELSQAQVERLEFTEGDPGGNVEGDIIVQVNSNDTPYAGEEQTVRIATDGMGEGQARRLVQQEVAPANGIVDADHGAAEQSRVEAANPDVDDGAVFDRDVAALQAEVGNQNMAQGDVVGQIQAANGDLATLHDNESYVAGARNNRADGVASAIDLRKTVADETAAESDNTGTNVWNQTGDTYAAVVGQRDADQVSESTKRQVDVLHAASQDLDVVADSSFETDGDAVFDEGNLTQESVRQWAGDKYGALSRGAGTSNEVVEAVRDWASDNLPES